MTTRGGGTNGTRRIAVFGGSFNPPGVHHRRIVEALARRFDAVKVVPCGPRPDKPVTNDIDPIHRAVMADLAFAGLGPAVEVDLFDLEHGTFTRNHELEARYAPDGEVWHVVGTDLIRDGRRGRSPIQVRWAHGPDLWRKSSFAVAVRRGSTFDPADLPPHNVVLHAGPSGASSVIRERCFQRRPIRGLVTPDVETYIERWNLYRGRIDLGQMHLTLAEPRLMVVPDQRNPAAVSLGASLGDLVVREHPNLVVVVGGDGTMLHAIQTHWRLRLPFFGVNTGHLGFLLNDVKDEVSPAFFRRELLVRRSPLLYVVTRHPDGSSRAMLAFNDAWVQAQPGKVGWFEVTVDGETRIDRLVGDGVLVATAAGSTASARAMGANPVPAGTDILVVVGSNVAQPLNWRTGANVPLDSIVEFRNLDATGWRPVHGFVDGVDVGEVVTMTVRASRIAAAELAFTPDHDVRKKLALTQFPGQKGSGT